MRVSGELRGATGTTSASPLEDARGEGQRRLADYLATRRGDRPRGLGEGCSRGDDVVDEDEASTVQGRSGDHRPLDVDGAIRGAQGFLARGLASSAKHPSVSHPRTTREKANRVVSAPSPRRRACWNREELHTRLRDSRERRCERNAQRPDDIGSTAFFERQNGAADNALVAQCGENSGPVGKRARRHGRIELDATVVTERAVRGSAARAIDGRKNCEGIEHGLANAREHLHSMPDPEQLGLCGI